MNNPIRLTRYFSNGSLNTTIRVSRDFTGCVTISGSGTVQTGTIEETPALYLDLRVRVRALEQEVLRLEVAVANVVLVVAVLNAAEDARNNHLFDAQNEAAAGGSGGG